MASVTPSKSTGEFIAKRVVAFMREVGCEQSDVTMKSDQEAAVEAAKAAKKKEADKKASGEDLAAPDKVPPKKKESKAEPEKAPAKEEKAE